MQNYLCKHCSMIEYFSPKDVIFSDFICTLAKYDKMLIQSHTSFPAMVRLKTTYYNQQHNQLLQNILNFYNL